MANMSFGAETQEMGPLQVGSKRLLQRAGAAVNDLYAAPSCGAPAEHVAVNVSSHAVGAGGWHDGHQPGAHVLHQPGGASQCVYVCRWRACVDARRAQQVESHSSTLLPTRACLQLRNQGVVNASFAMCWQSKLSNTTGKSYMLLGSPPAPSVLRVRALCAQLAEATFGSAPMGHAAAGGLASAVAASIISNNDTFALHRRRQLCRGL